MKKEKKKNEENDNQDDDFQDDDFSRPRFLVIGDLVFKSMDSPFDMRSREEIMKEEGWREVVCIREPDEQEKKEIAERERNFKERLKKRIEENRQKDKDKNRQT